MKGPGGRGLAGAAVVAALAGAAPLVLACGCARDPGQATSGGPSPVPAPPASALPADHLGPDELVEGKDEAYGVALPRGLQVDRRFVDTVHASGPMSVHALVGYFRPRLLGGSLREGEKSATFEDVTAPRSPPQTLLTIHLEVEPGRTRVDITATRQHEAPTMPDDETRWRTTGLAPNGRVLDPMHAH